MKPPVLIGICGGTASGKSHLAEQLLVRFKDRQATLLCLDRYYLNREDFPRPISGNYDHPGSVDAVLLKQHLSEIKSGRSPLVPTYDFKGRCRTVSTAFPPAPVTLVEGLLLFAIEGVSALMDTTVFVDAPPDIRLARRLRRDISERGRSLDSVLQQYESTVRPMHEEHVQPYSGKADFRVSGLLPPGEMVRECLAFLKSRFPEAPYRS